MKNIDGIIVKAIDGFFYIMCDEVQFSCKSRKKFRFKEIAPKVGDRVSLKIIDETKNEGVIEKIYKRDSDFIRPQLANISQAFLVFCYKEPKINFELMNKLILNFEASSVKLGIILNKVDSHNCEDDLKIKNLFENFPYEVIFTSAKTKFNLDLIREKMKQNISCFCGPSGVGKSSLLNAIIDKNFMETSDLSSKIKRGRHTTRFSQLIYLKDLDGYLVDTPGFTSIEIPKSLNESNLKNYFVDFYDHENCKFRECRHINEVGCNVKGAVNLGFINKNRYDVYVNLYNKFKERRK